MRETTRQDAPDHAGARELLMCSPVPDAVNAEAKRLFDADDGAPLGEWEHLESPDRVPYLLEAALRALAPSGAGETERDAVTSGQLAAWSDHISEVVFYARATARGKGYALAVHGSLFRDLDVVAVPWSEDACSAQELAEAICEMLVSTERAFGWAADCAGGKGHEKPLGRTAWSIILSRHDGPRYLDLSVAPLYRHPALAPSGAGEAVQVSVRTQRMDLHDELDVLFPVCADFEKAVAQLRHPAPATGGSERFDLIAFLARQRTLSERVFGPLDRKHGVVDHIRKELVEIEAAPRDLEEWIDVVLLAFDGAWRCDASPEAIVAMLNAKLTKNEQRDWPDFRDVPDGKAIEHVRPAPSAPQVSEASREIVREMLRVAESHVREIEDAGGFNTREFADAVGYRNALRDVEGRLRRTAALAPSTGAPR